MSNQIKKRIKSRLEDMGKSARAVSIEAGLGPEAISNVLRERSRYPRGDTLRDLATALNCSIDWLMTGQPARAERGLSLGAEQSSGLRAERDKKPQRPFLKLAGAPGWAEGGRSRRPRSPMTPGG